MKILYTSAEIRNTIIRLFKESKSERIAISAFVGNDADAYLPNPKGLKLICWPKSGGTNPNMLSALKDKGVTIFFADSVHMKVYWTKDKGSVVTSANLSTNALGAGGLTEAGVFLKPGELDIERLQKTLKNLRRFNKKEFLDLKRRHDLFVKKTGFKVAVTGDSFKKWYEKPSESRTVWKIGWWDDYGGDFAREAKEISKSVYNTTKPIDFTYGRKNDYKPLDWILQFRLNKNLVNQICWRHVDYVAKTMKTEKKAYNKEYPFQAIQQFANKTYPEPPFVIDKEFRKAFSGAVKEFGVSKVKAVSVKPTARLLKLIYDRS